MACDDDFDCDYDDNDCGNCGGTGYVASCFTEYACIDPEEGCDLCMRRCDWCYNHGWLDKQPAAVAGKEPGQIAYETWSESRNLWSLNSDKHKAHWAAVEAAVRAAPPAPADVAGLVSWTYSAARYFENRPTHGEDAAHWANVANAENARKAAAALTVQAGEIEALKRDMQTVRNRIPMDYLEQQGSTLDALKAFTDARWRIIERCKAAEARIADLTKALRELLSAADKIKHWHDAMADCSGMVVSADAVRGLWDAVEKAAAALAKGGEP